VSGKQKPTNWRARKTIKFEGLKATSIRKIFLDGCAFPLFYYAFNLSTVTFIFARLPIISNNTFDHFITNSKKNMKFKNHSFRLVLILFSLFSSLFISCTDDNGLDENLPEVETGTVSDVSTTSATCSGRIIGNGSSDITESGFCWSTKKDPTLSDSYNGNGTYDGEFSIEITGLDVITTYYVRAYAINEAGTAYGKNVEFKTKDVQIVYGANVKDIDGNEYRTVVIGTQTWMVENLKVTKYNDGNAISTTAVAGDWNKLTSGGYCWHNNDALANKATYGALYNWYAVNTGKLCPTGWHVPTTAEWETLTTYLGGVYAAGGKLKEVGTTHWLDPNLASNETGFTGVSTGTRNYFGTYDTLGRTCNFWSSTASADNNATSYMLANEHTGFTVVKIDKATGYTVRCIKN
jgi:uncharacterized protein (TIGR02145 family)